MNHSIAKITDFPDDYHDLDYVKVKDRKNNPHLIPGECFGYLGSVKDRKNNPRLIPRKCFGYLGSSVWYYLYDDVNVIKIHNPDDIKELDDYRRKNVPFAETLNYLKCTTTLESTIQRYNMLASKINKKIFNQLKQYLVQLSLNYKIQNFQDFANYTSPDQIDKIFNDCINHPPTRSKYLENAVYGYGGICSEFNKNLNHPLCSLYNQQNTFKNRVLYCLTDPLVNIKQIGNAMVVNMEGLKKPFEDLMEKLERENSSISDEN